MIGSLPARYETNAMLTTAAKTATEAAPQLMKHKVASTIAVTKKRKIRCRRTT